MHRLVIVMMAFLFGCSARLPDLELGVPVPVDAEDTGEMVMVSPAQFQHAWNWVFDNVEYTLGIDENGRVQFLSTSSLKVATAEGIRVGQRFAELQKVEGIKLVAWCGWGYVVELPSGWKAAFFLGESMTEREPQPEDRLDLLFRGTLTGYGARQAGEIKSFEIYPGVQMEFVWIPSGVFNMGSPEKERGRYHDEGPVHRVEITRGFWMGKYEVTQEQWESVMGDNPSRFKGNMRPVEEVSWKEIQVFIRKLNDGGSNTYRLPTEAEWEYACRAGTSTRFNTGKCISTKQANYFGRVYYDRCGRGLYRESTVDVGSFPPNNWDLHDMHGNVMELCSDWYAPDYYSRSPSKDPRGPSESTSRVVYRGGSWACSPSELRCATRRGSDVVGAGDIMGFRLVRDSDLNLPY
jgi:formylglycine-generating enzyme required for sulfatase activity